MKKILSFSVLALLAGFITGNAFAQAGKGQQLHLIYIDNSERGTGGGLPTTMLDYIFMKTLDSINQKDNNTSHLLYISNGDNPYFSRNPEKFGSIVNKLTERKMRYPSSIEDKAQMRGILYKDKLSGYESIVVDFYVTNFYLNQELLTDNPGYLLYFFPKELQYMTKCDESKVTVNVYFPDNPTNKEKTVRQKWAFSKEPEFASNIKYNFIGK